MFSITVTNSLKAFCLVFILATCACAPIKGKLPVTPTMPFQAAQTDKPSPQPILSPTTGITATGTSTSIPSPTPTSEPSSTPTLQPGATRRAPGDGGLMVYVPAGDFLMGSQQDDPGMDMDELPQHSVYLDPFWIDQVEVTNAMYAEFLNEMGNQLEGRLPWLDAVDEDVQIFQVDGIWKPLNSLQDYPVVEVTWFGASAYCHWAGKRLPTEAEWEKAARGAQARTYPWGEDIDCQHANYANCGRQKAVPVGSLPEGVSPYGALEMAANLWEWVSDWYAPDYYANSPVDNPVGPENGQFRVLRGGSFGHDWKHARSANRRNNAPTNSQHDYGFRCAMSTMP